MANPDMTPLAMALRGRLNKAAVVAAPGGQAAPPPGGDPSAGGGMPPGAAPPMDPAAMMGGGGMPPGGDPAMGGGDPAAAGGAPPMDPAAAGGMPPDQLAPAADPTAVPPAPPVDPTGKVSKKDQEHQLRIDIQRISQQIQSLQDGQMQMMAAIINLLGNTMGMKAPDGGPLAPTTRPSAPADSGGFPPSDPESQPLPPAAPPSVAQLGVSADAPGDMAGMAGPQGMVAQAGYDDDGLDRVLAGVGRDLRLAGATLRTR